MKQINTLNFLFLFLIIIWSSIASVRKDSFSLSILSIMIGTFLLISGRQKIYEAIVKQKIANRTFKGHRPGTPLFITGKQAWVNGILFILFCLGLIIIPLYFIIRDLFL